MNREEEISIKEKLTAFYESTGTLAWNMITKGNVHYGYWDQNNKDISLVDATNMLTKLMIDKTDISKGDLFCDIGCGVGMPAIALAKEKQCTVHGVTIVESQKNEADRNSKIHNVEEYTSFFTANALHMPFQDETYDGCWFFESIFHMGHKEVLKEACRILKPSATLVIADIVDIGVSSDEEKKFALEINNSACIKKEEYPDLLKSTGFELIEILDITEEVLGSLFEPKIVEAVAAHKDALAEIGDDDFLSNFLMCIRAVRKNCGYIIVKAKKRA